MISTEHDFTPGSPMYTWLENDLRNVDRKKTPWVIIAGHRAMYCSASIAGIASNSDFFKSFYQLNFCKFSFHAALSSQPYTLNSMISYLEFN